MSLRSGAATIAMLAAVLAAWIVAAPSRAETLVPEQPDAPIALKVAPDRYEDVVKPGTRLGGVIDVFNTGREALRLTPRALTIRSAATPGGTDVVPGDDTFERFVTYDPEPFTLKPGQARRLPFRILVPKDAELGGHFGAITFAATSLQDGAAGTTQQVLQSGTLFILASTGGPKPAAAVEDVRVSGDLLGRGRDVDARIENAGRADEPPLGVAFEPRVSVIVENALGMRVASSQRTTLDTLLPGAEASWKAKVHRTFWFGRYTATVRVQAGDGTTATRTTTFWAWSWPALLTALAVAGVLGWLAWRRWYLRRLASLYAEDDAASDEDSAQDAWDS